MVRSSARRPHHLDAELYLDSLGTRKVLAMGSELDSA
jgi:hypothetical protein